jgi:hypothetical protein
MKILSIDLRRLITTSKYDMVSAQRITHHIITTMTNTAITATNTTVTMPAVDAPSSPKIANKANCHMSWQRQNQRDNKTKRKNMHTVLAYFSSAHAKFHQFSSTTTYTGLKPSKRLYSKTWIE